MITEIALRFWGLLQATAPALLLAYVITAVLGSVAPAQSLAWLARGGHLWQAMKGMAVALPLPLCSCTVLPPFRRFVVVGGAPAAAVAFLLAGPEIGLDSLFISIPMLGARFTLVRVATAVLVALVASVVVARVIRRQSRGEPSLSELTQTRRQRAAAGWRSTLLELPAHTGPYILAGLALAALLGPTPPVGWLVDLPAPLQVLILASAGIPAYVCASAATPLVATLIAAGIAPGAGLAFLITGPATNITTFAILAQSFGRRAAWMALGAVCGIAVLAGFVANLWWPSMFVPASIALETPVASPWRSAAATIFLALVVIPRLVGTGAQLARTVTTTLRSSDTRS